MGKEKESVIDALKHTIDLGIQVVAIVVSHDDKQNYSSKLYDVARSFGIPVCSDIDVYEYLNDVKVLNFSLKNIDVVISYLFPKKIKTKLINLSRLGCINFHSAPLPKYRGWGVYNAGILNNEKEWGVSAHFVDENFDTGDLIKVNYFNIEPKKETAFSLERCSQKALFELFDEVMNMIINGETLPKIRQESNAGVNYSKKHTLNYEFIDLNDSSDIIDSKIRAFWYPPFAAKIILNGKKYSLVNSDIMNDITKKYLNSELIKP